MIPEKILDSLVVQTESKLVMAVIDGVGGLPVKGKTELEAAKTPNLDRLTSKSICGLIDPISYGITPGSGPSHVLAVTGDHSTPSLLKGHSWHPNPILLNSRYVRPEGIRRFTERHCQRGQLGRFPAVHILPLMLANGLKLKKFGA